MSVTRVTIVVALAIYVFLWVLALNGASSLTAPLLIPLVLAVLAAGVAAELPLLQPIATTARPRMTNKSSNSR